MTGRVYYERGRPVTILARWGSSSRVPCRVYRDGGFVTALGKAAPRNVLILREDGARIVRPFRGLRKDPPPVTLRTLGEEELEANTVDDRCPECAEYDSECVC